MKVRMQDSGPRIQDSGWKNSMFGSGPAELSWRQCGNRQAWACGIGKPAALFFLNPNPDGPEANRMNRMNRIDECITGRHPTHRDILCTRRTEFHE